MYILHRIAGEKMRDIPGMDMEEMKEELCALGESDALDGNRSDLEQRLSEARATSGPAQENEMMQNRAGGQYRKVKSFDREHSDKKKRRDEERDKRRLEEKLEDELSDRLLNNRRAACAIHLPGGFGSGCLVDGTAMTFPDGTVKVPKYCILTNQHVLATMEDAVPAQAVFNKESPNKNAWIYVDLDPQRFYRAVNSVDSHPLGRSERSPQWVAPTEAGGLDYCLVAVKVDHVERLQVASWSVKPVWPKTTWDKAEPVSTEKMMIFQHPGGGLKKYTVHDATKVNGMSGSIEYVMDTEGGSSGSPVFDRDAWLIGIHALGVRNSHNGGYLVANIARDVINRAIEERTVKQRPRVDPPPLFPRPPEVPATADKNLSTADKNLSDAGTFLHQLDDLKDQGNVRAIVQGMRTYRQESVQEQACRALRQLASIDKEAVATAGGIVAIITALQQHRTHAGVQKQGCGALKNLAVDRHGIGNAQIKEAICLKGGIAAVVVALQQNRTHVDVLEEGCRTLRYLADGNAQGKLQVAEADGISVIVMALQQNPMHMGLQEQGCAALRYIAEDNPSNMMIIATKKGIQAIVSALKHHRIDADVQEQGCGALANLINNDIIETAIGNAGGVAAIVAALKQHPRSEGVQKQGCIALYGLVSNANNQVDIAKEVGIEEIVAVLVVALKQYPKNATVQDCSCMSLNSLADNAINKVAMAKVGVKQVVKQAIAAGNASSDTSWRQELLDKLNITPTPPQRFDPPAAGGFSEDPYRLLDLLRNHELPATGFAPNGAAFRDVSEARRLALLKDAEARRLRGKIDAEERRLAFLRDLLLRGAAGNMREGHDNHMSCGCTHCTRNHDVMR